MGIVERKDGGGLSFPTLFGWLAARVASSLTARDGCLCSVTLSLTDSLTHGAYNRWTQARVIAGDVEGAQAAWRDAYQSASLITGGWVVGCPYLCARMCLSLFKHVYA